MTDPRIGTIKIPNAMPRLTKTPAQINSLGPSLGQHNAEVFGELLGLTAARLKELVEKGVV